MIQENDNCSRVARHKNTARTAKVPSIDDSFIIRGHNDRGKLEPGAAYSLLK